HLLRARRGTSADAGSEANGGAGADTTAQDLQVGEGGWQEALWLMPVMAQVIADAVVDGVRWGIQQAFGGGMERGHGRPPSQIGVKPVPVGTCTTWYTHCYTWCKRARAERCAARTAAGLGHSAHSAVGTHRSESSGAGGGHRHQPPHAAVPLRL